MMHADWRLQFGLLMSFTFMLFWLDHITTALAPFTPFYMIVVMLAAFYLNARLAYVFAIVCALFGTLAFLPLLATPDPILIGFRVLSQLFIFSTAIYLVGKIGKQAINEAEQITKLATDGANLGIWDWDLPSNEVTWSEQYFRIFGYAPDTEVSYDRFFASVHPEDREIVTTAIRHALDSGKDYLAEFRIIWPDGSERWIFGRGRPFAGTNGKPVRMTGIVMDITDRKQAEQALHASNQVIRASKQLLDSIIDSSPSLIFAMDLQQRITMGNAAYFKFMGLTKETVYGGDIRKLQPPEVGQKLAEINQHILDSGEPDTREEEIFNNAESCWRIHYTTKFPIRDAEGNITGLGGVATDITEIREAQAKLEERNRQIEILNEALQERAVQAESANRAKGFFIDNVSHEFRTPMNAVLGYSELLIRKLADPKQKDMAERIQRSGSALMVILNNMLDFSALSKNQLTLNNGDFCLTEVLQKVSSDYRAAAEKAGLTLEFDIAPDVPTNLHGDSRRLAHVLDNFLQNALKFTEQGTISLGLRVAESYAGRCKLRFEIVDTGVGIAADKLAGLFQPYTQGDASSTRTHGGTGIGLSLNRSLVSLMQGEVGADSHPGQGSKFWFTATFAIGSHACPSISNALLNGKSAQPVKGDAAKIDSLATRLKEELLEDSASAQATWQSLKHLIALDQVAAVDVDLFEARLAASDFFDAFVILTNDILPQAGQG